MADFLRQFVWGHGQTALEFGTQGITTWKQGILLQPSRENSAPYSARVDADVDVLPRFSPHTF
jgi:hypothetical protein